MPRTKGTKRRANGTGRVYKSNGVYYLQYRLPNGTLRYCEDFREFTEKVLRSRCGRISSLPQPFFDYFLPLLIRFISQEL